MGFETALAERIEEMVDACTRCGKCVEVCPSVKPAGIEDTAPQGVIGGVVDILRGGSGSEASRLWAQSCMLSGECVRACDYGVNPRFLLAMARVAMKRASQDLPQRRRAGADAMRKLQRDVAVLSRLQLSAETLARLGQRAQGRAAKTNPTARQEPPAEPDFVFYTGCNVLKTPHIALLALDIMDRLGIRYRVLGGPSHCCGVMHLRAGDTEAMGRIASYALDQMAQSKTGQVLAWCPSCYVQFTETTLPTIEKQRGARPFEMTPFMRFLLGRVEELKRHMRQPVRMRVALHRHPGVTGVVEAAEAILRAIPGLELVELHQPAVGLQSVALGVLPAMKRELQLKELESARDAGVDALVAVYHSDHRELCAHERDWPFRIRNILELIGESMGLSEEDVYKRLKIMQDADAILADCQGLIAQHRLNAEEARDIVVKGMLADQPLSLRGPTGA
ncbi:MAG TPA: (Fe-S)-binding protein [Stellaceae bacterium]|nr:(Fe-S)-binding protein [Stellaceae bacterium]